MKNCFPSLVKNLDPMTEIVGRALAVARITAKRQRRTESRAIPNQLPLSESRRPDESQKDVETRNEGLCTARRTGTVEQTARV